MSGVSPLRATNRFLRFLVLPPRWTHKLGSPALCVDCARTAPTFGLGGRHAYLQRRMNKLWPIPDCRIEQITPDGPAHLHIAARSFLRGRRCPDCGRISRAVYSRYERHFADLPSLGRSVSVHLRVRRLYCRNTDCARQTFVERLPKLVAPFARGTDRLAAAQAQTGLALGGEASTRLLAHLSMPVSADTV